MSVSEQETSETESGSSESSGGLQVKTTPSSTSETPSSEASEQVSDASVEASGDSTALKIPENLPKEFLSEDGKSVNFDAIAEAHASAASLQKQLDEARREVPEAADGYKIDVGDDFTLSTPEGDLEFNADDPLWGKFREGAHERRWEQADIDFALKLYQEALQGSVTATKALVEKRAAQELALLAPADEKDVSKATERAKARVNEAAMWLTSTFGDQGKAMADSIESAEAVKFFEHLRVVLSGVDLGPTPSGGAKPKPKTIYERWYTGAGNDGAN